MQPVLIKCEKTVPICILNPYGQRYISNLKNVWFQVYVPFSSVPITVQASIYLALESAHLRDNCRGVV